MIDVGLGGRPRPASSDPQALGLGLGAALGALGQADAHVDAGVAQVQGVRVALAAVADDGHLAARMIEGRRRRRRTSRPRWMSPWWQVGCTVGSVRRNGRPRAVLRSVIEREPRPTATMPDWTSSLMPNGSSTREQRVELVGVAGRLDRDGVGGDVDDLGAEQPDGLEDVRPRSRGRRCTLTSSSSRCTRRAGLELDDLDDVDQLVELLGHLLERQLLDVDHDRSCARCSACSVGPTASESMLKPRGEQARRRGPGRRACSRPAPRACGGSSWLTPVSRPRFADLPVESGPCRGRPGCRRCSCRPRPSATPSRPGATTKSTTTGTSLIAIAFSIVASTSSASSQRSPTQP